MGGLHKYRAVKFEGIVEFSFLGYERFETAAEEVDGTVSGLAKAPDDALG